MYNLIWKTILEKLSGGEEKVLIAAFYAMTLAVLTEVVTRYVFRYSLPQAEEFARYFMILLACVGLGVAWTRGAHIICDIKPLFMGEATRKRVDTFIQIFTLGLSCYYTYSAVNYFLEVYRSGIRTPAVNIPLCAPTSLVAIGFGLLSLHLLLGLLDKLAKWRTKG